MKHKISRTFIFKDVVVYASYLVVIWGFYRLFFKLPDTVEEVFVKPVIWLVPLFVLLKREKANISSLGISLKNLFPSLYMSIGLGFLFIALAVLANYMKYKGLNFAANIGSLPFFTALAVSLITAISEELSFRGYIFARTWEALKSEYLANFLTSVVWVIIHVPVSIFVLRLDAYSMAVYLFLTFLFGVGSSFIFARTKNIASSIILHVLWEWPIVLFR